MRAFLHLLNDLWRDLINSFDSTWQSIAIGPRYLIISNRGLVRQGVMWVLFELLGCRCLSREWIAGWAEKDPSQDQGEQAQADDYFHENSPNSDTLD